MFKIKGNCLKSKDSVLNSTTVTENRLQEVEDILNNRPRKRFSFLSPNEVYLQAINNNGEVAFMT